MSTEMPQPQTNGTGPAVTPPAPDTKPGAAKPGRTTPTQGGLTPKQRTALILAGSVALLIVAGLIVFGVFLVNNPAQASVWRDVFIIFMALEMIVIGAALVILMIQLAALINLLKNEVRPILEATQETLNTVRGTTIFLSENLTEPIVKLNAYVAGLSKIVETVSSLGNIFRRL
ncbi:MAG: hypothetical protein NZM11_02950 [Anaerolineales bacterium]|nr:hypothetical protein [Anaerolineales bacterium]